MSFLSFWFILFMVFFLWEPRRMFTILLFGFTLLLTICYIFIWQLDLFTYKVEDYYTINIVYIALVAISIPAALFMISLLLFSNTKELLQKEGRRVRNFFITVIACMLLFIVAYSGYFIYATTQSISIERSLLYVYVMGALFYFLWFFTTLAVYAVLYNITPLFYRPQYIIVLGSGLIGDKVPPLLASRLDRAAKLFKKHREQPLLVTSGGQGGDELVSEAFAMKQYLIEHHSLREDQILLEDQSTTTYENLVFSKRLLENTIGTPLKKGAIVTNDFHVLRASIYTRKVGLQAKGIAAKTAFYYVPNAFTREYVGLLNMYRYWHLFFLALYSCGFVLLYILFT